MTCLLYAHLEDAADAEAAGAGAGRLAAQLRAFRRGEAGPVVPCRRGTLVIGEPHPRDQVQEFAFLCQTAGWGSNS